MNGDGGNWVGEPNDPDAIVQLDQFHMHQAIRRLIADGKAVRDIEGLLGEKDVDGALEYLGIYADSVAGDDAADVRAKNALALLKYLSATGTRSFHGTSGGCPFPKPQRGWSISAWECRKTRTARS